MTLLMANNNNNAALKIENLIEHHREKSFLTDLMRAKYMRWNSMSRTT
jgi:hypothetical protein